MSPNEQLRVLLPETVRLALDWFGRLEELGTPVVEHLPPPELAQRLQLELGEPQSLDRVLETAKQTLRYSVRTGHPRFFNQLYGGLDPAGILGEWLAAVLNTSMYTYEVAPVATLMEGALIERLNQLVGFSRGEGVFTPGGSISNLMAVLAARHRAFPAAKRQGIGAERPVAFLSAEAHYSTPRALNVAGIGSDAAITVPVDAVGRMIPEELERRIIAARAEGRTPFLVVGTAGTTVAGAFDPLEEIAAITERHGLWFHVDASYGGGVLFADGRRGLMRGVERADSVAWNPHKMMGLPLSCAAMLVREPGVLEATHAMHAEYLFHGTGGPSWDRGDLGLQCGRRVDAFKLWFSWLALGDRGYGERIERLYGLAAEFRRQIEARPGFRLIREPEAPSVCFRYLPSGRSPELENAVTLEVRRRLLESGEFMINYSPLDGAATFRIVLSNPRTTPADLTALLDAIEVHAREYLRSPAAQGEAGDPIEALRTD